MVSHTASLEALLGPQCQEVLPLTQCLPTSISNEWDSGMVQQAADFNITITQLSWSAGIYLLLSGVSTLFMMVGPPATSTLRFTLTKVQPLSVKYGRRPALLVSSLTMGIGCIWCGWYVLSIRESYSSSLTCFLG